MNETIGDLSIGRIKECLEGLHMVGCCRTDSVVIHFEDTSLL